MLNFTLLKCCDLAFLWSQSPWKIQCPLCRLIGPVPAYVIWQHFEKILAGKFLTTAKQGPLFEWGKSLWEACLPSRLYKLCSTCLVVHFWLSFTNARHNIGVSSSLEVLPLWADLCQILALHQLLYLQNSLNKTCKKCSTKFREWLFNYILLGLPSYSTVSCKINFLLALEKSLDDVFSVLKDNVCFLLL